MGSQKRRVMGNNYKLYRHHFSKQGAQTGLTFDQQKEILHTDTKQYKPPNTSLSPLFSIITIVTCVLCLQNQNEHATPAPPLLLLSSFFG